MKSKTYERNTAQEFKDWFGLNMEDLRRYVQNYDEDIFIDAFLRAYAAIEKNGTEVTNFTGYFLQTYRGTFIDSTRSLRSKAYHEDINDDLLTGDYTDVTRREEALEVFNGDVLDFVRRNFDCFSAALFEIYIALSPDTSYPRLSEALGITEHRIRQRVGPIRKAVAQRFEKRRDYLLSLD